ncbi:MAG: aspartate 1-decarboxylase [Nitriliruptorales bacterium]
MRRTMMKSKIHRATATEANLHYMGSVTLDAALMEQADLLAYEKVQVVNLSNGARFETYAIEGKRGSGTLTLNGAAARLVHPGDELILISYAEFEDEEARRHNPTVVFVDEYNRVTRIGSEASGSVKAWDWSPQDRDMLAHPDGMRAQEPDLG